VKLRLMNQLTLTGNNRKMFSTSLQQHVFMNRTKNFWPKLNCWLLTVVSKC